MTYQEAIELAEVEAEIAFERFLKAFEDDEHPEIVDQLNNEAAIAQQRYETTHMEALAY